MSDLSLQSHLVDLDATYYEKNSNLQNHLAKKFLNTYHIDRNAHILDIGCGDGKMTTALAKRADQGKVLGIDNSSNMIQFSLKSFPKKQFPNLNFAQKKAEDIAFSKTFDLIVSFSCFHWIRKPKLAFQRLSAALKQKGETWILTYPKESPYYQYLEIALKKYPEYQPFSAYHTMLSIKEYQHLLAENHLEILNFQQCDFTASYQKKTELKAFIQGWLTSYIPLPNDLHSQFLDDVHQAVLKDRKNQEGQTTIVPYKALIIRAQKK